VFARKEVGDSKNPRYRRSRKSTRRQRYRYSQQAESDQGQAKRCSRHGGDSDKLEIKYSVPERRGVKEKMEKGNKEKKHQRIAMSRPHSGHTTHRTHTSSHTQRVARFVKGRESRFSSKGSAARSSLQYEYVAVGGRNNSGKNSSSKVVSKRS